MNRNGKITVLAAFMWFIVIVLFVGLIGFNYWLESQHDVSEDHTAVLRPKMQIQRDDLMRGVDDKVVRKARLDPNRRHFNNTIYFQDKEIAHFKSDGDRIFDLRGEIPDGRIHFIDETFQTYGTENFEGGKRRGPYKEYQSDGQLKKEILYSRGKSVETKEFYPNGALRMEQDFRDALWYTDLKEIGVGKVYFPDGTLKYEWNITNSGRGGYNRSYNQEGKLVAENHFDEKGQLIKTERW